jgi:hypothetical protein
VKVVSVVLFENLVPIFQTSRPLTFNAGDAGKSQNFVFLTISLIGAVEVAFQNHDPLFLSTVAGSRWRRSGAVRSTTTWGTLSVVENEYQERDHLPA